ncbi:hypothetical protein NFI96_005248 [Prochilodus magdalenae]|nr:hypothetical protein NFI96_005248 [Prochilodus magdalenae]
MSACSRSLLLGLMIILYLQSCVDGQHVKGPEECCFSFFTSPIPVYVIRSYKETGAHCPKPGLIAEAAAMTICPRSLLLGLLIILYLQSCVEGNTEVQCIYYPHQQSTGSGNIHSLQEFGSFNYNGSRPTNDGNLHHFLSDLSTSLE